METRVKSNLQINEDKLEITMSRVFDAPRELVFQVSNDPKHIPHWWGPRRLTTTVEQMDVRPGGAWRFIQRDPAGNEFAFHGNFLEIDPPQRVVQTFNFEGIPPGHEVVETVTFEDLGGKTRMTTVDRFKSLEDLRGMVESGMESGAVESVERLEELLEKLQG